MSVDKPSQRNRNTNTFEHKILILFAHPSFERSEVNSLLVKACREMSGVTFVDLYAEYPKFDIDIDREQARLLQHDIIVFMHPLYWYSTPAILKEWQDLVLEHDFAYGSKGNALQGKVFFSAITAGGVEAAYSAEGYQHFTIRELLQPLEQMASLCGMIYLPPFSLFSARTAVEEHRIENHVADWVRLLNLILDDKLDMQAAMKLPKLNRDLDSLVLEDPS